MKRIVICYDGTWNAVTNPNTVTNVVRVGQAVRKIARKDGFAQVVYYNAGVGSGGPLDRFLGGVFGAGLRSNVKRGLAFLTLNWEPGDEIYIFGFSRGAYSARALAGVIGAIRGIPKQESFDELERVWNYYRREESKREAKDVGPYIHGWTLSDGKWVAPPEDRPLIKCLGVWDTVGSYGIPDGLGLGALARKVTSWTRGFHNNRIGRRVEIALHAMAIDERRRAFPATAWVVKKGDTVDRPHVEQVWFAGSHSNIGGGYDRSGLADLALIWMIARVSELTDLDFNEDYIAEHFWPCAACSLYNSARGWVLSTLLPRTRPVLSGSFIEEVLQKDGSKAKQEMVGLNEKVHWSVIERIGRLAIVEVSRNRTYAPSNLPEGLPDEVPDDEPPDDPRVAWKTDREKDLIARCRKRKGMRIEDCALFCRLGKERVAGRLGLLRDLLSAKKRRERRQRQLRKIWKVEDPWGSPPGSNEAA